MTSDVGRAKVDHSIFAIQKRPAKGAADESPQYPRFRTRKSVRSGRANRGIAGVPRDLLEMGVTFPRAGYHHDIIGFGESILYPAPYPDSLPTNRATRDGTAFSIRGSAKRIRHTE